MSADQKGRSGVTAGGNWIVDRVKFIDAWPPEDSLANIKSERTGNGGAPYNVLKDLSRLGAQFPLEGIGLVGEDGDGDFVLADCRRCAIDTRQLGRTKAAATSYTDVMTVPATGRRTFFHQRGANALLRPEHFDFAATRCKLFHFGYVLLLDGLDALEGGRPRSADVFRRAREAGLQTSLDCVSENSDRFRSIVGPLLPEVDVFFANDTETETLTRVALSSAGGVVARRVEHAAREILSLGVRRWVILHFPEAAFALSAAGEGIWQASLQVPQSEIAGAAGAGDAFASGVLYGQHLDWPIRDALRFAVCVAASSLSDATCSEGIGSAADCQQLAERWSFRRLPV